MANIYVPIVASYPNYDNVIKNAERCEELGHSVTLYRALKRKPYKRLSKFMFGVPWGDPELRAKSVIEKVPAASCIIAAPTGGVGTMTWPRKDIGTRWFAARARSDRISCRPATG
jgi:hypothetical protein